VSDEMEYGGASLPKTIEIPPQGKALTWFQDPRAVATITPFIPKGVSYAEIVAEASQAIAMNPELRECTPMSLLRAIGRCAQTGLIIGETVHLVAFNTKVKENGKPDRWEKRCQRIIGYNGEIELVKRAGGARLIYAEPFYEQEVAEGVFKYEQGTEPRILHRPILNPDDRGPIAGAYAVAKVTMYDIRVVVQSIKEIDAVRAQSKVCSPEKVKVCPPWWAKKRVIHLLVKQLPMNPRMRMLAQWVDEDEGAELDGEPVAIQEAAVA
jgi:recombination protein RecT